MPRPLARGAETPKNLNSLERRLSRHRWVEASYGVTARTAELVTPRLAEIVTVLFEVTVLVVTVKVAVVEPGVAVMLEGTVATAVLLLESVTLAPPVGAGPLRVTVPVEGVPP